VPLQNRVTPFGELVAVPERGMFMGNRGVLHDRDGRIVRAARGRRWICCLADFKGRRRALMQPGRYTELFFLDEATALASGHRPCAECRRADAMRFRAAWTEGNGHDPGITLLQLDAWLADDRLLGGGAGGRPTAEVAALPDGAMVAVDGYAHLVTGGRLRPWSPAGYGAPRPAPETAALLTPPSIVAAIAGGYAPALHPSAGA
jgi:hypothetical protein